MNIINILTGCTLVALGGLLGMVSFVIFIAVIVAFSIITLLLCTPIAIVLLGLMLLGRTK